MKMRKLSVILLFLLTGLTSLNAETITVNGTARNYLVYAPSNLGENRPLLISCHGMNQDAAYQKSQLQIESIADTAKFVTVFPDGINKGWDISGDRDINFVLALIDAMVTKYKINRNCVYLSGFSMGGMFTYHAMNRIADKIAAFAPISGYPMGGTTANASVRPIPIIHTHGTGDDVVNFGGVQGALNAWIQHNHCSSQASVVTSYRGASHVTRRTWGSGDNGVEVVLMELKDKGHWISNDIVKTGDEIWKFCKRYSLQLKNPQVRITSPKSPMTYVTMGGKTQLDDLTITATAKDPDGGTIEKVEFYDGKTLLATVDAEPYTATVSNLKAGTHNIRVVATDNEGNVGESTTVITIVEPAGATAYVISNVFTTDGSVPEGWVTYDGKEKRVGYSDGYSQGSRIMHLTADQKDFEWGLYTRNVEGNARAGYARFGSKETTMVLTLNPGNYELTHRVANWNIPSFSPIRVAVEDINGKTIQEETFTPTANVGNSKTSSFSGTTTGRFRFNILETTRCQVTFYTSDGAWSDLIIGRATVARKGVVPSAIEEVNNENGKLSLDKCDLYDLQGRLVTGKASKGVYMACPAGEKLHDGNAKKILVK
jgi:poly(3-hydroxybutyrate) depolymerase